MKKVITIFMILLLCACGVTEEAKEKPINDAKVMESTVFTEQRDQLVKLINKMGGSNTRLLSRKGRFSFDYAGSPSILILETSEYIDYQNEDFERFGIEWMAISGGLKTLKQTDINFIADLFNSLAEVKTTEAEISEWLYDKSDKYDVNEEKKAEKHGTFSAEQKIVIYREKGNREAAENVFTVVVYDDGEINLSLSGPKMQGCGDYIQQAQLVKKELIRLNRAPSYFYFVDRYVFDLPNEATMEATFTTKSVIAEEDFDAEVYSFDVWYVKKLTGRSQVKTTIDTDSIVKVVNAFSGVPINKENIIDAVKSKDEYLYDRGAMIKVAYFYDEKTLNEYLHCETYSSKYHETTTFIWE